MKPKPQMFDVPSRVPHSNKVQEAGRRFKGEEWTKTTLPSHSPREKGNCQFTLSGVSICSFHPRNKARDKMVREDE